MHRLNTIFSKVLLLTIVSILSVSLILVSASLLISERILLNQVVNNSYTNLTYASTGLLDYNNDVLLAISKIQDSAAFKNYITTPNPTNKEQLNLVLQLGQFITAHIEPLHQPYSHLIVSGIDECSNRYYTTNGLKWDLSTPEIIKKYMTVDGEIPNKILYHGYQEGVKNILPSQNYIFATKPLVNPFSGNMYGYIAVIIDELNLFSKYSAYVTEGTSISVIASDGLILSSSTKSSISTYNKELLSLAKEVATNSSSVYKDTKNKITTISIYLPFYDAYIVETIDQKVAFSKLYNLDYYMLFILSVVLFLAYMIIRKVCQRITSPLTQLIDTMCSASGQDLQPQAIDPKGTRETTLLTKAYNSMVNEINAHVTELVCEQEERRKAELSALQMQINPHFLYNTLSSIKYLAKSGNTAEVDQTIDCLIAMLQNTIGTTSELVTLKEEFENLEFYIYINQMRYGNHIKVDYTIPEECLSLKIPKLLVQPFIENAFFHAFVGRDSGNINLFITQLNDTLTIEIMDNGVGMDLNKPPSAPKSRSGIGIKNVDERIKLLYGPHYGVTIQSDLGYGTSILITLPCIS